MDKKYYGSDTTLHYLQKAVDIAGGPYELAMTIGVKKSHISRWIKRDKQPSSKYVLAIEEATNHQVCAYQLRPDMYKKTSFYTSLFNILTQGTLNYKLLLVSLLLLLMSVFGINPLNAISSNQGYNQGFSQGDNNHPLLSTTQSSQPVEHCVTCQLVAGCSLDGGHIGA